MSTPSYDERLAAAPPPRVVPGARAEIARLAGAAGRRVAVLDDDPTGSQSVHGVQVVFALEPAQYRRALDPSGSTAFVLTNSRSLDPGAARALAQEVGTQLLALGRELGAPITLVSRSDSTLRGHLVDEVIALDHAAATVTGRGFDGVLLVPAFLEAGRATVDGVHWARVGGEMVPVGSTEFAADASFGFRSSDLRDWVAEKTAGAVGRDEVVSLTLTDIRAGGRERVAEVLDGVRNRRFVVVDAAEPADLDVVALGVLDAEAAGRCLLHRTGPSMVASLGGIADRGPVTHAEIRARMSSGPGHGLVVVGSHVGLTNRQLEVAQARGDLQLVELPVDEIDGSSSDVDLLVRRTAAAVRDGLRRGHVLLRTARAVRTGHDAAASLTIARAVSWALSATVRAVRDVPPAWVIAKGGITAHDVATRGLGIRRAVVLGQLLPGQISVFDPVELDADTTPVPYVVFAGNVGDEHTLSRTVGLLCGDADTMEGSA